MDNDLTNEITNYRGDKLHNLPNHQITAEVKAAIDSLAPGANNGLQGISADEDGITAGLWRQAVSSAEMDGSLTFPQHRDDSGIPTDARVVSFEQAKMVLAGRVARAILHVNGYISPYMEAEPGSYGPDNQNSAWYDM